MTESAPAATTRSQREVERWPSLVRHLLLAAATYVPLLLTARGRVVADTKSYLYLDPGRLLERAPSMWDPNVGLGTVTHQNIGYLFPMGPWFWAFERLGAPDWVAQRLWLGTIMFAAGAGVLFLLRTLGWGQGPADATEVSGRVWRAVSRVTGGGALAAAVVYMLSPYVLNYGTRLSVLLLPWAGLPWMIGLTQRALRSGSWRHPALFAVVVTIVGGVNATALLLAGIGPLLWVLFAVWVQREVTLRGALAAVARIGVLTLGSSLWWMSGLATQGSYGIDVLRYSETVATVAETSSAPEVLRGLGYWFFYGGEKSGPWIPASRPYMEAPWLIAAGFTLTGLALVAAVVSRWRQRAFFVGLVVIGTAVAVGPHPFQSPSPIGAVFKRLATSSTAGLAMRSTPRAVPLIVLGVAVLLAAGLAGLARVRPRPAVVASLVVMGIAVVGLAPLWSGDALGENLMRDEDVPSYWHEAAAYLDDQGTDTRVLEVPGSDFASYRWGNTVDPITPGLMDRPYVARELIPYGSPASADLLNALDRRFQDDVLDPGVLAPVARRLGAGDIVVRSDLAFEDYRTPRPRALWDQLVPPPEGLAEPVAFGPAVPNRADRFPMQDEVEESIPRDTPHPPPVGVFEVEDPMPIIRTAAAREPLLLAGDGEGVIQAGAAGLLDGGAPLFYSAATAGDPALREQLLDDGADLVLTDTNRKRGRRWSTVWENTGYTEPAGSEPLRDDISDNRLPLFPAAPDTAFTTVDQRGVREVKASRYGNPVTFTPDDRAANALDGDVETSWSVGDFSPVVGERIVIELDEPVTTDRVELVQPVIGPRDRFITRVEVVLDGESIGTFPLDESSRTAGGQSVDIGEHTFSTIELVVAEDNIGARRAYGTLSPVGFAEVRVADIAVDEVVQLPSDLLDGVGARSAAHDLTVLLERARGRVYISPDEEPSIVRGFGLPSERRFTLEGDARVSAVADEATIDRALGYPAPADGGIAVESSTYLRGNLAARGASALDGDPSTSWRTEFAVHNQIGASLTVGMPGPVTLDRLDLVLLADGDHSVPTRLRIVGGSESRTVEVPAVEDQPVDGATQSVTVSFDPLTTDRLQVVVEAIRPVEAREYYSERPGVLPIGVAELGIPGVLRPTVPAALASPCREDLLELDGEPIGVRVTGSTAEGVARAALALERCGGAADAIPVGAGDHVLRAAPGAETGIDLDRLVLRSDASPQPSGGAAGGTAPRLETVGSGRTSLDLQVSGADGPFWVVLGQSHSPGWTAEVDGGERLGASTLVDGYANGWYVDPRGAQDLALNLEWQPQRRVRAALVVSGAFLVLCLGIVAWGWRRRTPASLPTTSDVELASPLSWNGGRLRPGRAVVLTLAGAAAAALVVSPLAGAVVGATVAAALALQVAGRRGRPVLVGGAIASYGLAVGLILARQLWRGGFDADFEWPSFFPASHVLAWIGLALLAVDVLLDQVEARRRSSPTEQRGQPAEA